MTDEELYHQIEEYREESQAVYERIHEQVETSIVKHAQAKKRRKKLLTGIASVVAVVIVVLAIVLPIALQPQDEAIRYADANTLIPAELDCNLKEYYSINKLSLLYLDWYENAEDMSTMRYYEEGKESDTVYLAETITDGNSGYTVQLTVMKRNIVIDSFDGKFDNNQTTNIGDTQIYYVLQRDCGLAKFEHDGYKYYLEFNEDELTLEFLVETIKSMFNN